MRKRELLDLRYDASFKALFERDEELSMDDDVATKVLKEQQEEFELRSKLDESRRMGMEQGREQALRESILAVSDLLSVKELSDRFNVTEDYIRTIIDK